jgi:hypothetical protein
MVIGEGEVDEMIVSAGRCMQFFTSRARRRARKTAHVARSASHQNAPFPSRCLLCDSNVSVSKTPASSVRRFPTAGLPDSSFAELSSDRKRPRIVRSKVQKPITSRLSAAEASAYALLVNVNGRRGSSCGDTGRGAGGAGEGGGSVENAAPRAKTNVLGLKIGQSQVAAQSARRVLRKV